MPVPGSNSNKSANSGLRLQAGDLSADSTDRRGKSEPSRALNDVGPREIGGPKGPDPTRYGDWERGGRCIDF
jgi:hypothetical protein